MKNKLQSFKQKLASYIYIYIYRAAHLKSSNSLSSYIKFCRNLRVVGFLALAALLLVMTLAVCPITLEQNSAEVKAVSDSSMSLIANVEQPSIEVTIPQKTITMNLSLGQLSEESAEVQVTSTSQYGYTLIMTSSTSSMLRTQQIDGNTPSIPTLLSTSSTSDFPNNRWGLKKENEYAYRPLDISGTKIGNASSPTTQKSHIIDFASKVGSETPAGSYQIELNINATANISPISIDDLTEMQEFGFFESGEKQLVLSSMEQDEPYTLTDSRDGDSYTISKLSDGMVWMTKNLDLDGGITLTPSDTNIVTDFRLPESTTEGFPDPAPNGSAVTVYNSNSTDCSDLSVGCYSYYSYMAATAGTGPDVGNAEYDICPIGWRLPTVAEYNTLIATYNTGVKLTAAPFNAVYSGQRYGTTFGAGGFLRTSYSKSSTVASYLYFSGYGAVTNQDGAGTRYRGFAIRCVLK